MRKRKTKATPPVDLDALRDKLNLKTKYKAQDWYFYPKAFQEALGVLGNPVGGVVQLIGLSDSGKTTDLITGMIACQERGDLPVIIITEEKFQFDYAQRMGFKCEKTEEVDEETGEVVETWTGDFIYKSDFDYIEQVYEFMNNILNLQESDELPRNICFFWDSVGSIKCKMSFEGKGGNMHDARVLSELHQGAFDKRIKASRRASFPYDRTMLIVNQAYQAPPDSPMGQPKLKPKGGNAVYYSASMVRQWGGVKASGTQDVTATLAGRKFTFGKVAKCKVLKYHAGAGISRTDGRLTLTPHGIIPFEKAKTSINKYKKDNVDYFKEVFSDVDDFDIADLYIETEEGSLNLTDEYLEEGETPEDKNYSEEDLV
jgi:RecA/RadA recombinase